MTVICPPAEKKKATDFHSVLCLTWQPVHVTVHLFFHPLNLKVFPGEERDLSASSKNISAVAMKTIKQVFQIASNFDCNILPDFLCTGVTFQLGCFLKNNNL